MQHGGGEQEILEVGARNLDDRLFIFTTHRKYSIKNKQFQRFWNLRAREGKEENWKLCKRIKDNYLFIVIMQ